MYTPGISVSADEFKELSQKEITMLIWGWADYDDIFPYTKRHRTEFCLQIKVITQPDGGRRIQLPTYPRFNGFDDECLNKPKPYDPDRKFPA